MFIYKIDSEEPDTHPLVLRGYFLRLEKWRNLDKRIGHLQDWKEIKQKFLDQVCVQFFERAYMPCKEDMFN